MVIHLRRREEVVCGNPAVVCVAAPGEDPGEAKLSVAVPSLWVGTCRTIDNELLEGDASSTRKHVQLNVENSIDHPSVGR